MAIDMKPFTAKNVPVKNVYVIKEVQEQYITHYKLSYPEAAATFMHNAFIFLDRGHEHFISISLNTKREFIAANVIGIGSINACIVNPREVFYSAVVDHADSVILCHNHPSGNTSPSQNDIDLTRKMIEAGGVMGIEVADHIILGDQRKYYSMKEQNLI